jgi:hypothetical protein
MIARSRSIYQCNPGNKVKVTFTDHLASPSWRDALVLGHHINALSLKVSAGKALLIENDRQDGRILSRYISNFETSSLQRLV